MAQEDNLFIISLVFFHKRHDPALCIGCLALTGCALMSTQTKQRQVASMLSFLFPGQDAPPPASDGVAELKVSFRVGVAFAPAPQFLLGSQSP